MKKNTNYLNENSKNYVRLTSWEEITGCWVDINEEEDDDDQKEKNKMEVSTGRLMTMS